MARVKRFDSKDRLLILHENNVKKEDLMDDFYIEITTGLKDDENKEEHLQKAIKDTKIIVPNLEEVSIINYYDETYGVRRDVLDKGTDKGVDTGDKDIDKGSSKGVDTGDKDIDKGSSTDTMLDTLSNKPTNPDTLSNGPTNPDTLSNKPTNPDTLSNTANPISHYKVEKRTYDFIRKTKFEYNAREEEIRDLSLTTEDEIKLFEDMISFLEIRGTIKFQDEFKKTDELLRNKVFEYWKEKGSGEFLTRLITEKETLGKEDIYTCFIKRREFKKKTTRTRKDGLIERIVRFNSKITQLRQIAFLVLQREKIRKESIIKYNQLLKLLFDNNKIDEIKYNKIIELIERKLKLNITEKYIHKKDLILNKNKKNDINIEIHNNRRKVKNGINKKRSLYERELEKIENEIRNTKLPRIEFVDFKRSKEMDLKSDKYLNEEFGK